MSVLDDFKDIENQQNSDIKQEIISEIYSMYMPLLDQLNQRVVNLQERIDDLDHMLANNISNINMLKNLLTGIKDGIQETTYCML
jgi:DNA-binding transcriptional regulator GbsR (MarR family)